MKGKCSLQINRNLVQHYQYAAFYFTALQKGSQKPNQLWKREKVIDRAGEIDKAGVRDTASYKKLEKFMKGLENELCGLFLSMKKEEIQKCVILDAGLFFEKVKLFELDPVVIMNFITALMGKAGKNFNLTTLRTIRAQILESYKKHALNSQNTNFGLRCDEAIKLAYERVAIVYIIYSQIPEYSSKVVPFLLSWCENNVLVKDNARVKYSVFDLVKKLKFHCKSSRITKYQNWLKRKKPPKIDGLACKTSRQLAIIKLHIDVLILSNFLPKGTGKEINLKINSSGRVNKEMAYAFSSIHSRDLIFLMKNIRDNCQITKDARQRRKKEKRGKRKPFSLDDYALHPKGLEVLRVLTGASEGQLKMHEFLIPVILLFRKIEDLRDKKKLSINDKQFLNELLAINSEAKKNYWWHESRLRNGLTPRGEEQKSLPNQGPVKTRFIPNSEQDIKTEERLWASNQGQLVANKIALPYFKDMLNKWIYKSVVLSRLTFTADTISTPLAVVLQSILYLVVKQCIECKNTKKKGG